jgi:hypothetical protein
VHHEVAAFPSMAFAAGLPDCEVVAAAWPDSAQLTAGTWLAPGGDPAVAAGPACAVDAAMSDAQSESPAAMAPQRLIMGLTSDRPFA